MGQAGYDQENDMKIINHALTEVRVPCNICRKIWVFPILRQNNAKLYLAQHELSPDEILGETEPISVGYVSNYRAFPFPEPLMVTITHTMGTAGVRENHRYYFEISLPSCQDCDKARTAQQVLDRINGTAHDHLRLGTYSRSNYT